MAPTRTHLTIAQKNELRAHHADDPRMNHDDLRLWAKERFQREIGRSTVSTIVSKPQQRALNTTMKHSRPCLYPEMESELLAFVDTIEEEGVLSDLVLYEKANMLLAPQAAKVSLGWVQKFKRRHGIRLRRIHGESGSVDVSDVERQQRQLRDLLDEYSPADVYNFDETGLFFRMLPSQSLATKAIRGKKTDKERITTGLCANTDGADKLPAVVIHRAKSPRCFRDVDSKTLPVRYYWNTKAWMTRSVWAEWFHDLDMQMHGRKILLLVDNAPGHAAIELSNLMIHFLPPNTMPFLQPMDAGIIRSFKCKYKVQFVRWVIDRIDNGQKSVKMDVLAAIKFAVDAWQDVTATTIRNCWCHTGIVSGAGAALLRQANDPRRMSNLPELTALIERLGIADRMAAEEYVCVDDDDPADNEVAVPARELELPCGSTNDESADEEDDEQVFSHGEAVQAIQQLSVYASGQSVECRALSLLLKRARAQHLLSMKQQRITSFFSPLH